MTLNRYTNQSINEIRSEDYFIETIPVTQNKMAYFTNGNNGYIGNASSLSEDTGDRDRDHHHSLEQQQQNNSSYYPDGSQGGEEGVSTFDGIELPIITDANLYIKNIDYDISDDALYSVFSQLGEITSHHIVRDATKRSRGFGFM